MIKSQLACSNNTRDDKRFQTKYYRKSRLSSGVSYLPNSTSQDINLNFQALGILSYIFSHSDDWKIIPRYIAKIRKFDGVQKVYTCINHLIDKKYAVRLVYRGRLKNGQWGKQYFGYHFFDMPASEEDIEKIEKEFQEIHEEDEGRVNRIIKKEDSKKEYRESVSRKCGQPNHGKGDIQQEQEENNKKETTTQSIVDKSGVGSNEPPLLPSSKKGKKKKEPSIDQSSLLLFDNDRNYLKGKSESEIRLLYLHYQKKKHSIKDPVAYLTACAAHGWHLHHVKNDEYLIENYRFAKRIEDNFYKLGKNGNCTYFNANADGMVFMKSGVEVPLPGYDIEPKRFKEYMEEIFTVSSNYSKEIFL